MKVAAGVLGIVAGIMGMVGGFATAFVGAVGQELQLEDAGTVTNLGAVAFWVSVLIIICGIVAFFKPRVCGILMIIGGIVTFIASNYFSGPIAILGGIFGIIGGGQPKESPPVQQNAPEQTS